MKRIRINYIHVGKIISNLSNVCKTALRQHIGNTIESLRVWFLSMRCLIIIHSLGQLNRVTR